MYPERQLAKWTAIRYTSDHILDYVSLDQDHAIFEVNLPEGWEGKTVGQIDIRKKYGINILAVKRDGKMDLSVQPNTQFRAGDTLLVLGDYRNLQKCFHI